MKTLSRRAFLSAWAPAVAAAQGRSSGRGTRLEAQAATILDALTERPTQRLTPADSLHHLPHYHHRFLSRKNEFVLVGSERTGSRQIFRLDLYRSQMHQLTEGPGVHTYSAALDHKEKMVFFLQENELMRVPAGGGRARRIYRAESGWRSTGHLAVSATARHAAVVEMHEADWADGFEEQFAKRPRCRIQLVDLRSGQGRLLVGENQWLAHPQFRPGSDEVLYCREGPWEKVERLWLMRPGASSPRNLRPRQGDERVGHEYWSGGEEVCYVHYPDATGRGATVRCVSVATGQERSISRCTRFGWLSANDDNSVIVGASRSLAGPNIYVLFSRLQREITICEHASSGKPYPIAGTDQTDPWASAPEPVFSHDSQWIYFVSDREGLPAVYRVAVPDLVELTEEEDPTETR